MLGFRKITIDDRDRINAALMASDFMGCEYSFANNLAWCRLANSRICFYKNFYIICAFGTEDGIPTVTFPSGVGDIRDVLGELTRFCGSLGHPLRLGGVTEKQLEMLREIYPEGFAFELDRDGSDYIYRRADLAELRGKKFHGKRNHLARYNETGCEFSVMTEKDFDDCIAFITAGYNEKGAFGDHSAVAEQYAVNTYFSHFHELGLKGGIIRHDGKIAAVTIGEGLNSDTFCVHIEKADRSVDGIYAGINNCFVKACTEGFQYINREEDLGIEGLRKAKLSYNPLFLLKKHIVTFK